MQRIKRYLSFSNVIAVTALFFALGGTVYAAGKLSGAQIKPKSIPANRIKPKSLTGTQIKPGSLTGAQINSTTLKGVSAASLASVQYVSSTVALPESPPTPPPYQGVPVTAVCPAGQKVIGGGAHVSNEAIALVNDSAPTLERTGWTATGFAFDPGSTITVTAICAPVVASVG